MTCSASCICACNQSGCGCRERKPSAATSTVAPPGRQWTKCGLCSGRAPALLVVTEGGAKLVVKFCPTCDTRRPK